MESATSYEKPSPAGLPLEKTLPVSTKKPVSISSTKPLQPRRNPMNSTPVQSARLSPRPPLSQYCGRCTPPSLIGTFACAFSAISDCSMPTSAHFRRLPTSSGLRRVPLPAKSIERSSALWVICPLAATNPRPPGKNIVRSAPAPVGSGNHGQVSPYGTRYHPPRLRP